MNDDDEKVQFNTYPTRKELELIKESAKKAKQSTSDYMVMAALLRAKSFEV
jgi:uncharacterized protein (DUF1778 family)